jgi:hypothetical protein
MVVLLQWRWKMSAELRDCFEVVQEALEIRLGLMAHIL